MPMTVNGCGTMYYGKKNLQKRRGICRQCNNEATLESYQTRLWIVFVFIPVIPLGRKQIVDKCSICSMHFAIPLEEWERMKGEATAEAMQKAKEKPDDPAVYMNLHGTLAGFGQVDEAKRLAEIMTTKFANDLAVQIYLGVSRLQEGSLAEADANLARALELAPDDPEARRLNALRCIDKGNLDQARQLLSFMEQPGPNQNPALLAVLAQAYQDAKRYQDALALYEIAFKADPKLEGNRKLRKKVKACKKALGKT